MNRPMSTVVREEHARDRMNADDVARVRTILHDECAACRAHFHAIARIMRAARRALYIAVQADDERNIEALERAVTANSATLAFWRERGSNAAAALAALNGIAREIGADERSATAAV